MSNLTAEQIMAIPVASRTQKQWDVLHDTWSEHPTWCKCQLCKDVEAYLNQLHTGGRARG